MNWLQEKMDRALDENWCMETWCTTCGSFQFRRVLHGDPESSRPSPPQTPLTKERASVVCKALGEIQPPEDDLERYHKPIRVLLFWLWEKYRQEAHDDLFPILLGSYAGEVLEDMKAHFAGDRTRKQVREAARISQYEVEQDADERYRQEMIRRYNEAIDATRRKGGY